MMKRSIVIILASLFIFSACVNTRKIAHKPAELEVKGVWFSFFDWNALPHEEDAFKRAVSDLVGEVKNMGLNVIYLHAHSHSDSYYKKSTYFPLSKYVAYTNEFSEDFDAFEYFIEEAHSLGIEVHAWFNPYRVGNQAQFEEIQAGSILYDWKKSDEEIGSRYILCHRGAYYLNPSSMEVLNGFTNAVRELCQNYNVDGVHFDDYFYPAIDDSVEELSFDKADWEKYGSDKSLENWRKDNVSALVQSVYAAVHEELPDAVFGISPSGNLSNLLSSQKYLVDLDRWLGEEGFVDYLIPQIYWGFEPRLSNGNTAPWAFENCLAEWLSRMENTSVALYIGLGLYRCGDNVKDGNEVSEWLRYNDIIARQIESCCQKKKISGFVLFDWRDLKAERASGEVENLRQVLRG